MKNSVCFFTTEWPIKMDSEQFDKAAKYFPEEFNLKVYREYEKLRWSKGLSGGTLNQVNQLYKEIFSKENIEAFENSIYCDMFLKLNDECFKMLPSSGHTIRTSEINPTLLPSTIYPFRDWELKLKFTSKQYTILETQLTDDRGIIHYKAVLGNLFAAGIDVNKNEVLKIMVSSRLKTHIVASKEI